MAKNPGRWGLLRNHLPVRQERAGIFASIHLRRIKCASGAGKKRKNGKKLRKISKNFKKLQKIAGDWCVLGSDCAGYLRV
jgi:hypothetical protein